MINKISSFYSQYALTAYLHLSSNSVIVIVIPLTKIHFENNKRTIFLMCTYEHDYNEDLVVMSLVGLCKTKTYASKHH